MTPLRAFGGSSELRKTVQARLRLRWEQGLVVPGWDLQTGPVFSVMGACLAGDDYAAELGIPLAVGRLHELLVGQMGWLKHGPDGALSFVATPGCDESVWRWLGLVRPGADLGQVVPHVVVEAASHMLWALHRQQRVPVAALLEVASQLGRAHARFWSGSPPADSEWRDLRAAACAATDACESLTARAIAEVLEDAAWPPDGDPSVLVAALQQAWMTVRHDARTPHLSADEVQRNRLLEQYYALAEGGSQVDRDAFVLIHPQVAEWVDGSPSDSSMAREQELDALALADLQPLVLAQLQSFDAACASAPVPAPALAG